MFRHLPWRGRGLSKLRSRPRKTRFLPETGLPERASSTFRLRGLPYESPQRAGCCGLPSQPPANATSNAAHSAASLSRTQDRHPERDAAVCPSPYRRHQHFPECHRIEFAGHWPRWCLLLEALNRLSEVVLSAWMLSLIGFILSAIWLRIKDKIAFQWGNVGSSSRTCWIFQYFRKT
jgi:hypothetical protein